MQQISDHVRQEFLAISSLYAQPAQYAHTTVSAYVGHRGPIDVPPPPCHYPSSGYSPVHAANHHLHPVYANGTSEHSRMELRSVSQAQLPAGSPPCMLSHSMYGQHLSPQQVLPGNHSLPAAEHQLFVPLSPVVQHPHAQLQDLSLAPQAMAADGQPASQKALGSSFQHTNPASKLHGVSPWQHTGSALPHRSSARLHQVALSATLPAPACGSDQPQLITAPQQVAAVVVSGDQGDGTARSISQPYAPCGAMWRIPYQNQNMPLADNHMQLQHAAPVTAALCGGTSGPQVPLGAPAGGASPHLATSLAVQTPTQAATAAMPATQEAPVYSVQHPCLHGQQCYPMQQQEHSALPLLSGAWAPHSLPAQEPGGTPTVPPGACATDTSPPSKATGFSSLLHAVEQGVPANASAAASASASAGNNNAAGLTPHTHAAGGIAFQYPTAAGSRAVLSTPPESRPIPLPAPAHTVPSAGMVRPSAVPDRSAWSENPLHAASKPAQHLASSAAMPGQVSPQLRQSTDTFASVGNYSAATPFPPAVGQTGFRAEQVASEGSFRFQPQTDCVQGVPAGVCCTPVLRPRIQEVACTGKSVSQCFLYSGARHTKLLCKYCKP